MCSIGDAARVHSRRVTTGVARGDSLEITLVWRRSIA